MGRLIIITFILSSALGAPKRSDIKQKIASQKKIVGRLVNELHTLEKNLGKKNDKYIQVIGQREAIEHSIFNLKESLSKQEEKRKAQIADLKSTLGKIIISQMEEGVGDIVARKILRKKLEIKIINLNNELGEIEEVQTKISSLSKRLGEYVELENQLASLIEEMEKAKSSKTHIYAEQKESYYQLSQEAKKEVKRNYARIGLFAPPLKFHEKINYKNKGITYIYRDEQPVYATRKGQVVHYGPLSTFGHVLMIDHGSDIRSVFLGQFKTSLKKGSRVQEGEIIGRTISNMDKNKFYFEVRKKDKVQNTIYLLAKKDELQQRGNL